MGRNFGANGNSVTNIFYDVAVNYNSQPVASANLHCERATRFRSWTSIGS